MTQLLKEFKLTYDSFQFMNVSLLDTVHFGASSLKQMLLEAKFISQSETLDCLLRERKAKLSKQIITKELHS